MDAMFREKEMECCRIELLSVVCLYGENRKTELGANIG